MSEFAWNDDKNAVLKTTRGVSFEEVVRHIHNGKSFVTSTMVTSFPLSDIPIRTAIRNRTLSC